jgi:hypothetical protein
VYPMCFGVLLLTCPSFVNLSYVCIHFLIFCVFIFGFFSLDFGLLLVFWDLGFFLCVTLAFYCLHYISSL